MPAIAWQLFQFKSRLYLEIIIIIIVSGQMRSRSAGQSIFLTGNLAGLAGYKTATTTTVATKIQKFTEIQSINFSFANFLFVLYRRACLTLAYEPAARPGAAVLLAKQKQKQNTTAQRQGNIII